MIVDDARADVEALLRRIGDEIGGPTDDGSEATLRAYLAGGKRVRAEILLWIAVSRGTRGYEAGVRYAAFIELMHAGGLCHDDVVDRSAQRRGQPTIARLFGSHAASTIGLFLMLRAYRLLAADSVQVRRVVAIAADHVARGQADEMANLFNEQVEVDTYLERCGRKTAALFELAASLGATAADFDDVSADRLVRFARRLGMAFQLADDLRDFVGEAVIGREAGTDLREGVYTYPILLTLTEERPGAAELRRLLRKIRGDVSGSEAAAVVAAICRILRDNGTLHDAWQRTRAESDQANLELLGLDDGALRERLGSLAEAVLSGASPSVALEAVGEECVR